MDYKNKANITLLCVFMSFILICILKYFFRYSTAVDFLFTVSEASLVGGAADWFAITALFRKPFGIISFHTAIIPRNRRKIIESISNITENQLFTGDMINDKILKLDFREKAAELLEKNRTKILGKFRNFINEYIGSQTGRAQIVKIDQKLREILCDKIFDKNSIDKLYTILYTEKNIQKSVDFTIKIVNENHIERYIYKILVDLKNEKLSGFFKNLTYDLFSKMDAVSLEEASVKFKNEIIYEISGIKNKDSKNRYIAQEMIEDLIIKLSNNKDEIKENAQSFICSDSITLFSEEDIYEKDEFQDYKLTSFLMSYIETYYDKILKDDELLSGIERISKYVVISFIKKNKSFISSVVTDTMGKFDDKKLNEFIESKFGDDLQWIRINGSVLGAIIGGIMFIVLKFVYDPVFSPIIRKLVYKMT